MRRSFGLLPGAAASLAMLFAGTPAAYAGCLDNAGQFIFAALSGGATVATCELEELVKAIKNLIQTVNGLASKVAIEAHHIGDAAVTAVNHAANEFAFALSDAQHILDDSVAQAAPLASVFIMAPATNLRLPPPNGAVAPRGIAMPPNVRSAALQAGTRSAPNPAIAPRAPMLLKADPQRLHAALQRGLQTLTTMRRSLDQQEVPYVNAVLEAARNKAATRRDDADHLVQTALLAPINSLRDLLNDLAANPARILDPVGTINKLVDDITKKSGSILGQLDDIILKEPMNVLAGVEAKVQQAQSEAHEGSTLLDLMRRARQEGTQVALEALESDLNRLAPQQNRVGQAHTLASLTTASFRFAPVRSRVHATLAQAIAPTQSLTSKLKSSWAAIRAQHPNVGVHPLDPSSLGKAKVQLDRMFAGKSASQVARAKRDLLDQARLRYGANAQLVAAISQNLDGYLRTHSLASVRAPVIQMPARAVAPPGRVGGGLR